MLVCANCGRKLAMKDSNPVIVADKLVYICKKSCDTQEWTDYVFK